MERTLDKLQIEPFDLPLQSLVSCRNRAEVFTGLQGAVSHAVKGSFEFFPDHHPIDYFPLPPLSLTDKEPCSLNCLLYSQGRRHREQCIQSCVVVRQCVKDKPPQFRKPSQHHPTETHPALETLKRRQPYHQPKQSCTLSHISMLSSRSPHQHILPSHRRLTERRRPNRTRIRNIPHLRILMP
jgi:hypothetical protein